jgi:hypothetical protein
MKFQIDKVFAITEREVTRALCTGNRKNFER